MNLLRFLSLLAVAACPLILPGTASILPVHTLNNGISGPSVGPRGDGDRYGAALVPLGTDRFANGIPLHDRFELRPAPQVSVTTTNSGAVAVVTLEGAPVRLLQMPNGRAEDFFGTALAALEDGGLVIGLPGRNLIGGEDAGAVALFDAAGNYVTAFNHPAGTGGAQDRFGSVIAPLGGMRYAVGVPRRAVGSAAGAGVVYLFEAGSTVPLATVPNPEPQINDNFGGSIARVGDGTLVIGAALKDAAGSGSGSVYLYDHAGTRLRTIHNPRARANENFGWALAPFGAGRFLVSAPGASVVYLAPTGPRTNQGAGLVFLFDASGAMLRTFQSPVPAESGGFGMTLAPLDADRFLVGAPLETVNGTPGAGRFHVFNGDGVHLGTVDNPAPGANDQFAGALAAVDERRVASGAAFDDTVRPDAGSVYLYDLPVVRYEVGSEMPRPDNVDVSGAFPQGGPRVEPVGAGFWHVPSQKLFLTGTGDVLVSWPLLNGLTNNVQAFGVWSTNDARYQVHVAGAPPVDLSDGGTFATARLLATSGGVDPDEVQSQRRFFAATPGRNLVMVAPGNPAEGPIRFLLVKAIAWSDPKHLHDDVPALVGQPVVDTFGYHDPAAGGPWVVQAGSVHCALPGFHDRAARTGPIIPVNRDRPSTDTDDLVIAYYRVGDRLHDPASGTAVSNTLRWPSQPVRYRPQWPTDAPRIVIASLRGTGEIDPARYVGWELYHQNDPGLPGYNPNDEHALRRPFGGGEALFALRDDLATAETSEPFVLMSYRDPDAGLEGRIRVFAVVAEEAPYFFRYDATAGTLLQPPFPLSTLQVAEQSHGVSGPYWRDRKKFHWARAAGSDGGPAEIVMRFFYPMQPGFHVPGPNPPQPGTNLPLLDHRAGTPGVPHPVAFTVNWPDAPELRVGETLVKPKFGLPDIAQQTSVEILYQQASAQGLGASVRLIDPTREVSVSLDTLPGDVATHTRSGRVYFSELPPSLRNRLRYEPVERRLVFRGEFIEPTAGESHLLLNVLTQRERSTLLALSNDPAFDQVLSQLANLASAPIEVPASAADFDSLALTAGFATAPGFVTLAFGNHPGLNAPADPVSLAVIRVTCPLYRGEIKVIPSDNPFEEKLTLRHSGDFAGRSGEHVFEWRTLPPVDGLPSTQPPSQWALFVPQPASGQGAVDITLQGPGLLTLSDNYFICRYRRTSAGGPCGGEWSDWTDPMLAEGWIKRVLGGINPFEQRVRDYANAEVNTLVSMISQAGARSVGDIALNLDAANGAGLIEAYETVLKRGIGLSIEGAPAVDYPPANDALLLAAGRLADLYMLLGNEAYADAADPTIAFGTAHGTYGSEASSIHCFKNQVPSLLHEELALLRGRDDSLLPSVRTHPTYNRLIWNFTRDLTGGEMAYALNYNIRDEDGDIAGILDESDARRLYPQGHGDAWGHYLTAIKNYYRLLRSPHFTWVPRAEAVLVGGVPVSVDYLDERKFATAASARAKTGAEIVNLTYRQHYVEDPEGQWQGYRDTRPERAWGLAEWGSRAGQGAYFDWVVANAILPDLDPNPGHTGIRKIDRTTVLELREIAAAFQDVQSQVDQADLGLNPLGLARNVVPFDIDPAGVAQGRTHFEQIQDRAVKAMNNAIAVFNHANNATQLLRQQADQVGTFRAQVEDREADFENRLIEVFGYPYSDDIGPTGTYPSGYSGPDLYHFEYVDASELLGIRPPPTETLTVDLKDHTVGPQGQIEATVRHVTFHLSTSGLGLVKPASWTGSRRAPGEIQMARSEFLQTRARFQRVVTEYGSLLDQIEAQAAQLLAQHRVNREEIRIYDDTLETVGDLDQRMRRARASQRNQMALMAFHNLITEATAEALPLAVGLANDVTSVARGSLLGLGALTAQVYQANAKDAELEEMKHQQARDQANQLASIRVTTLRNELAVRQQVALLEQLVRQEALVRLEIFTLREVVLQSAGRYAAVLAHGQRLLEDRLRFRRQTAAQVQAHRYKDMAFRVFRNDALQKYRAAFDLAARYVYLAARAYDFETALAPNDPRGPGEAFMNAIVRSRALGLIQNGQPLTGNGRGDPGLADPLARLQGNWDLVLKGQLGFNNPQTETGRFSLRSELFRVQPGAAGQANWRRALEQHVVPNLLEVPEYRRYCIPFTPSLPVEPGLVIPFGTTVNFGQNFFGWPAGGGDNDYDSTHFATKIRSVGVWFANYNNLGGGMINTPRVYLVPAGSDILRAPSAHGGITREWRILDQALPVPFPLSPGSLGQRDWIPMNDSLVGDLAEPRRFARFRAYHDSGSFLPSETSHDSRLIGRSVWNTQWLLIIPAGTLHTDRDEGLARFIQGALLPNGTRDGNGVTDIKVFFQTYSYAGH
ncbi:MAG: hypothetical protein KF833_01345 [Verrucomicrobiae bacterium]|nr:hypothetical protein [Verrucomicrobiae bacterium]